MVEPCSSTTGFERHKFQLIWIKYHICPNYHVTDWSKNQKKRKVLKVFSVAQAVIDRIGMEVKGKLVESEGKRKSSRIKGYSKKRGDDF